ncbi:MAG: hypothetical protein L6R41_006870, partial [Letrouitia leprolyta]
MDAVNELPLAVRRKRRASSRLVYPTAQEETSQSQKEVLVVEDSRRESPKTPGNRKKRARISEPTVVVATLSTGLTPALNRTKLVSGLSTNEARKRLSLPTELIASDSSPPSSQFPDTRSSQVIQFAPLRQAIDPRMMRRLKRNHLADEVNNIFAEKRKSKLSLRQEIEDLRDELALARDGSGEAMHSTGTGSEGGGRIAALENELFNLKEEMRERSATIDTTASRNANIDRTSADTDSTDEAVHLNEQVLSLRDDDVVVTNVNQNYSPTDVVEASTQVDLPSPSISDICRSARLSFEYLFPGETALGLDISDPQPLIEAMILRAKALKEELDRTNQTLAVSETSKTNMGRNFNATLAEIER